MNPQPDGRTPIVGEELPPVAHRVAQHDIDRYAAASGGRAGIHIDPEYARRVGLDGTIAHGMMTLSYVDQMLAGWLGLRWYRGGTLDLKFVSPVRPGDTVTARGRVVQVARDATTTRVSLGVWAENQRGERVLAGEVRYEY